MLTFSVISSNDKLHFFTIKILLNEVSSVNRLKNRTDEFKVFIIYIYIYIY